MPQAVQLTQRIIDVNGLSPDMFGPTMIILDLTKQAEPDAPIIYGLMRVLLDLDLSKGALQTITADLLFQINEEEGQQQHKTA